MHRINELEEREMPIVDIEELMKNWAKKKFDARRKRVMKKYRKLPFDEMNIVIKRPEFRSEHDEADYEKDFDKSVKPCTHVLFKSQFSNTTSQAQTFNLHTERCSMSNVNVALKRGFCFGEDFSLTVGLPKVSMIQGGFVLNREVNVEKSGSVHKEAKLTWAVDSQIVVPPQTTSVAELAIEDREYTSEFKVKSLFRGKFDVYFMKGNLELFRAEGSNLKEIFTSEDGFEVDTKTGDVCFETHGVCTCRFGIDQEVKITETKNKVD